MKHTSLAEECQYGAVSGVLDESCYTLRTASGCVKHFLQECARMTMGLKHLVCLKKPVGCNSVMHNSCFFVPFMFPKTDSEPNPAPMWWIMERLQQCFICEQMCLYFRCPFWGGSWVNRGKVANSII